MLMYFVEFKLVNDRTGFFSSTKLCICVLAYERNKPYLKLSSTTPVRSKTLNSVLVPCYEFLNIVCLHMKLKEVFLVQIMSMWIVNNVLM
jgi:hypothetical protein